MNDIKRSDEMTPTVDQILAIEFDTAHEATQWTCASRHGEAVLLDGRHYVMERDEAERLAAGGVEFAYLFDHEMPDRSRRIVTVPVND